jgi:DNA-binding IclR family transcriptional regulator
MADSGGLMTIDAEVLAVLRAHGALDLVELVALTGVPGSRLQRVLADLVANHSIEQFDRGGPAPVYRLPRTMKIERPAAATG